MADWTEARVVDKVEWSYGLFSLKVDAGALTFKAGQYTRLGMDIDGARVARPYSFVNSPDEPNLEFYFNIVPSGPLSSHLAELGPGDGLWVDQSPAGFLTLDEVPEGKNLWCMSTGTAIGPFLSILRTEEPWRRFDQVVLVHAVRSARDATYSDVLDAVQKSRGDQFRRVLFVSRESADQALAGRIPDAIKDGRLEQAAGIEISAVHSQVMICGNPDMVKDTSSVLKDRGLKRNRRRDPGHITVEHYW